MTDWADAINAFTEAIHAAVASGVTFDELHAEVDRVRKEEE